MRPIMPMCRKLIIILASINFLFIEYGVALSSENIVVQKKAYGIIKRINSASAVIIIMPVSGIFKVDDEVEIYEKNGNIICKGKIKSVYTDEIFVKTGDIDINTLRKGLIVSRNYTSSDVKLIDEDEYNDGLAAIDKSEKEAEQAYMDAKKDAENSYGGLSKGRKKPPVYYKHYSYSSSWTKEEFHKYCKGCHQERKSGPTKCDDCHRK